VKLSITSMRVRHRNFFVSNVPYALTPTLTCQKASGRTGSIRNDRHPSNIG
jgi:hypothetical protein